MAALTINISSQPSGTRGSNRVRGKDPMTTTTTAADPAASLIGPPISTAVAVSYLRVSTREQARSEERRVGKGCGCGGKPYRIKKGSQQRSEGRWDTGSETTGKVRV